MENLEFDRPSDGTQMVRYHSFYFCTTEIFYKAN